MNTFSIASLDIFRTPLEITVLLEENFFPKILIFFKLISSSYPKLKLRRAEMHLYTTVIPALGKSLLSTPSV